MAISGGHLDQKRYRTIRKLCPPASVASAPAAGAHSRGRPPAPVEARAALFFGSPTASNDREGRALFLSWAPPLALFHRRSSAHNRRFRWRCLTGASARRWALLGLGTTGNGASETRSAGCQLRPTGLAGSGGRGAIDNRMSLFVGALCSEYRCQGKANA